MEFTLTPVPIFPGFAPAVLSSVHTWPTRLRCHLAFPPLVLSRLCASPQVCKTSRGITAELGSLAASTAGPGHRPRHHPIVLGVDPIAHRGARPSIQCKSARCSASTASQCTARSTAAACRWLARRPHNHKTAGRLKSRQILNPRLDFLLIQIQR